MDLFSLGVIVFIMCTGCLPFNVASLDDKLYACIIEHSLNDFWRVHEECNGAPFGAEFKDLISNMLAYQPFSRLSLAEV